MRLAQDKHGSTFSEKLKADVGDFMLDLAASPEFNAKVPTVAGTGFGRRFVELKAAVNNEIVKLMATQNIDAKFISNRKYREPVVKPLQAVFREKGDNTYWAVAALNADLQKVLHTKPILFGYRLMLSLK